MKTIGFITLLATSLSSFAGIDAFALKKLCPNMDMDIARVGDVIVFAPEKCIVEELPLKDSKVAEILKNQKLVFTTLGANDYSGIGHLAHFKTNAPVELELKKENIKALEIIWMYFELKSSDANVFASKPLSIITALDHKELKRRLEVVREDNCYSCHDFDFDMISRDSSQVSRDEFSNAISKEVLLSDNFSDPEEIQIILDVWGAEALKILFAARSDNDLNIGNAIAELKTYFSDTHIISYPINDVGNENTWQGFYVYQSGHDIVLKSFIWDL
jgi:hypothetical protein